MNLNRETKAERIALFSCNEKDNILKFKLGNLSVIGAVLKKENSIFSCERYYGTKKN